MTQPITINGIPLETILSALDGGRAKRPMGEYAVKWFETFKKKKLRPGTQKTYASLLGKYIVPFFGDTPIECIGVPEVQELYDSMGSLSKSTVRQTSVILHQIFHAAIEDKLIATDPTTSDRLSYSDKVTVREALSQDDIRHVIRQLVRLKGRDLLLMSLLIYTGERRGEALGLRWEDIDFEGDMIHVRRAVCYTSNQPSIGPTKSRAGVRPIPLLPELKEVLLKYRKSSGFIVGKGDRPLTERAYRCMFDRIARKLELHGATAHVFRHTFCTMAVDSVDLKTLQTIAGHASHVTTMRYVHARNEKIAEAKERLAGMFA